MAQGAQTETETHHNQALTGGAAARLKSGTAKPTRKVVALQLNQRERAALQYLGGVDGLKALLCPAGLCIHCREAPSIEGTWQDSFCQKCADQIGDQP